MSFKQSADRTDITQISKCALNALDFGRFWRRGFTLVLNEDMRWYLRTDIKTWPQLRRNRTNPHVKTLVRPPPLS